MEIFYFKYVAKKFGCSITTIDHGYKVIKFFFYIYMHTTFPWEKSNVIKGFN